MYLSLFFHIILAGSQFLVLHIMTKNYCNCDRPHTIPVVLYEKRLYISLLLLAAISSVLRTTDYAKLNHGLCKTSYCPHCFVEKVHVLLIIVSLNSSWHFSSYHHILCETPICASKFTAKVTYFSLFFSYK